MHIYITVHHTCNITPQGHEIIGQLSYFVWFLSVFVLRIVTFLIHVLYLNFIFIICSVLFEKKIDKFGKLLLASTRHKSGSWHCNCECNFIGI